MNAELRETVVQMAEEMQQYWKRGYIRPKLNGTEAALLARTERDITLPGKITDERHRVHQKTRVREEVMNEKTPQHPVCDNQKTCIWLWKTKTLLSWMADRRRRVSFLWAFLKRFFALHIKAQVLAFDGGLRGR